MNPTTSEDREDIILKIIEKSDGIGFNEIQRQSGLPKKTVDRYLKELTLNKTITRTMNGEKLSHGITYTANFSEDTKEMIAQNLAQITQYNLSYYDTKYRKSNVFPHFLQELAAEYYQNLISYFFNSIPEYKFGLKRIEEFLEIEKKKFDKEFKGKNKVRLHVACLEVQSLLSFDASGAAYDAAERNMHRTRDEIKMDCTVQQLGINIYTKLPGDIKRMQSRPPLEDHRLFLIEDKKLKETYIEVLNEYDALSRRLRTLKIRLAWMVNGPPWEPKDTGENPEKLGN